ncbi:MAG: carboxypeptidase-like regulatory domain-containing protein [Cyclobacteriaceae bacterium]|nr:carboxypeptidase-like regulatory domain-containing protein [Cyclobacteriaceae bacterium]
MSRLHCKAINKGLFLFIVISFSAEIAAAQSNKISGTITDAETGEPIPFANVFFANTSIGISSDTEGKFVLQNFPNGKYDFTVAYVGYEPFQQAFEFNETEFRLTISLKTEEVKLREVIVKADTTGWAQNFATFRRNFLGETENSLKCRILNPRDIHLYFDRQARVLVAHASKPIVVENLALGFTLTYYLRKFELDYAAGRLEVFGIPSFQQLIPKNDRQKKQWNKERERAYYGSIPHYMRSVLADTWREEGFEVRQISLVPNPDRPPKEFLDKKLAALKADITSSGDSLVYYSKLATKPELVEEISKGLAGTESLVDRKTGILAKGAYSIRYKNEKEEAGYPPTVGRTTRKVQDSILRLFDSIKVYENGYHEPVQHVFVEQYWGWSEKISDMLPFDYKPQPDKE